MLVVRIYRDRANKRAHEQGTAKKMRRQNKGPLKQEATAAKGRTDKMSRNQEATQIIAA